MSGDDENAAFVRSVLHEAASAVEPADRLDAIRARTARRPRGWIAAGAVALAAAAAVVAVVVLVPADPPHTVGQRGQTASVYYLGPGPNGPDAPATVLFPEQVDLPVDPLRALMARPDDPDYRSAWPEGSLVSWQDEGERIVVRVDGGPVGDELARQQVAWTMRSATGRNVPVELVWDDGRVLVDAAPELDVVSHMSITSPEEGARLDAGSTVTASGRANGYEGTVFCQLLDARGDAAWEKSTVNGGLLDETLNPWKLTVDLRAVDPGRYTFTCRTDDPTAGTSGRGSDVDDRSVTVR